MPGAAARGGPGPRPPGNTGHPPPLSALGLRRGATVARADRTDRGRRRPPHGPRPAGPARGWFVVHQRHGGDARDRGGLRRMVRSRRAGLELARRGPLLPPARIRRPPPGLRRCRRHRHRAAIGLAASAAQQRAARHVGRRGLSAYLGSQYRFPRRLLRAAGLDRPGRPLLGEPRLPGHGHAGPGQPGHPARHALPAAADRTRTRMRRRNRVGRHAAGLPGPPRLSVRRRIADAHPAAAFRHRRCRRARSAGHPDGGGPARRRPQPAKPLRAAPGRHPERQKRTAARPADRARGLAAVLGCPSLRRRRLPVGLGPGRVAATWAC